VLNVVLPKGSLEAQTLKLFEEADLPVRRGGDNDYNATIRDPRIERVKILRPQEIPIYVERGHFDLGIAGQDWVVENASDVVDVMELGGSGRETGVPIRVVLAVPQSSPVASARDLKPGTRISTEYCELTRRYFAKLGIPVEVYRSYGATEAKVPEIVDAIVDATETGSSLRRNGMKIVETLLESTLRLIANRAAWADPAKRQAIEEISTLLGGVLNARGKVLIKLNVAEENLQAVTAVLPGMKSPTISRLYGTGYYAVEAVAVKATVNLLIPELKKQGAEDILELPISKIVI